MVSMGNALPGNPSFPDSPSTSTRSHSVRGGTGISLSSKPTKLPIVQKIQATYIHITYNFDVHAYVCSGILVCFLRPEAFQPNRAKIAYSPFRPSKGRHPPPFHICIYHAPRVQTTESKRLPTLPLYYPCLT